MARLLSTTEADIQDAGARLRDGFLCAFPTETVYGLGANALNEGAAKRIFEVKGRPPTDPLICHVSTFEEALPLWSINKEEVAVVSALQALWPGPMTVVAKAAPCVPSAVTGGSGCVGVRIPNHEIALKLLAAAKCPICAPSANLFGHVSPTSAAHVMEDLAIRDDTLTVIDGGNCAVGIESTVLKVTAPNCIEILRRGLITPDEIRRALEKAGLGKQVSIVVRDTRSKSTAKHQALPQDGPGQLLTHYSPNLPTYLLPPDEVQKLLTVVHKDELREWSIEVTGSSGTASSASHSTDELGGSSSAVAGSPIIVEGSRVIVIDYLNMLKALSHGARAYRSLHEEGDPEVAAQNTFDSLRWSETIDAAEAVVFPYVTMPHAHSPKTEAAGEAQEEEADKEKLKRERAIEVLAAVEDRLFRAASGVHASLVLLSKHSSQQS